VRNLCNEPPANGSRDASCAPRIRGKRLPPSLPGAIAERALAAIWELAAAAAERAYLHVRRLQKCFDDVILPRINMLARRPARPTRSGQSAGLFPCPRMVALTRQPANGATARNGRRLRSVPISWLASFISAQHRRSWWRSMGMLPRASPDDGRGSGWRGKILTPCRYGQRLAQPQARYFLSEGGAVRVSPRRFAAMARPRYIRRLAREDRHARSAGCRVLARSC
jgi:hypothetical protein